MRTRPPQIFAVGDEVLIRRSNARQITAHQPGRVTAVRRKYLTAAPVINRLGDEIRLGLPVDYEIETGAARDHLAAMNGARLITRAQLDYELEQAALADRLRKASPGDSFRWATRIDDLDALEKVVRIIEQGAPR